MEYITIQDVKKVSNLIPISEYLSQCLNVEIHHNTLKCPICGGNRKDKASIKTGYLICFGCGFKGDAVELHKILNNKHDIYEATRDLMQQFNISSISSNNKSDMKKLEQIKNENIKFKNNSLKAFEELNKKCISIYSSDKYSDFIRDFILDISMELMPIIKKIQSKSMFTDNEKQMLRNEYLSIKKKMQAHQRGDFIANN